MKIALTLSHSESAGFNRAFNSTESPTNAESAPTICKTGTFNFGPIVPSREMFIGVRLEIIISLPKVVKYIIDNIE